jgi:hypothetical protein
VRLRVVGRVRDEAVLVTAGLNLPSGMARLTPDGVDALRVGAAPMLGLGSPPATSGAGGTLGVVLARSIKGWAVAVGSSYEQRGRFQPVAARLLGTTPESFTPGGAVRATLGLSWRHRGRALEPFVRAQGGNLRQRLGRNGLPLADSDFFGMTVGVLLSTPF